MPNEKDGSHAGAQAKANNTKKFPDPQSEGPTFPPILDALSTGPDGKVCPFIPATILMMPVNPKQRTGLELMGRSSTDVQGAFVRQYTPCVKGLCMAWQKRMEMGEVKNGNEVIRQEVDKGFCRLIP